MTSPLSFPRQHARTRRFTLGRPRGFVSGVGPDGPFVLFLRTDAGDDPVTHLWLHEPAAGRTRRLVDARGLGDADHVPPEERARRERAREQAGGIVSFATSTDGSLAAFTLAGRLFTVTVPGGEIAEHPTVGPAFDPRPSPDGTRVGYHAADGLHLVDLDDGPASPGTTRTLVSEPGVSWGRAEFVAAEEMGRSRGFWWAADGAGLAVARVDERQVDRWTIADPAAPWDAPTPHPYPAAGSVNAEVSLWVVPVDGAPRLEVELPGWSEYLAHVVWGDGPLTALVQSRDQTRAACLRIDDSTGASEIVRDWTDPSWIELVPGAPRWVGERILTVEDRLEVGDGGTRMVCLDGEPLGPAGLQVREVVGVRDDRVVVLASREDPTAVAPWAIDVVDGRATPALGDATPLDGVTHLTVGRDGGPDVLVAAGLRDPHPVVEVVGAGPTGGPAAGPADRTPLEVVAEEPVLTAEPRFLELGPRELRAALFLPRDGDDGPLPVVLDPYGGPHAQRVVRAHAAHLTSQWLADQGFAVLVVDGRGSPGRGPVWERAVHRDLATPVLDDQVEALQAAAELEPRLDLGRVALRGWSFGGYLAALAVLRRPDVFHAGIAGAPVTDWALYDTHYTERYLGRPDVDAGAYAVSSLVDRSGVLLGAQPWHDDHSPALLLIHGLADDNVVAAHTLRLSSALLADGRSHRFLPLSGVTHMTPQEIVAERLLEEQVRFLRETLRERR